MLVSSFVLSVTFAANWLCDLASQAGQLPDTGKSQLSFGNVYSERDMEILRARGGEIKSAYYSQLGISEFKKNGSRVSHREFIGTSRTWVQQGDRQLKTLKRMNLRPSHRVLDLGCGALRLGVKLVDYLEPGNYYGIDINPALLEAGYNIELGALNLTHKLPIGNLHASSQYDARHFGVTFDFVWSNSVWSHIPLDEVHRCLRELMQVMKPGALYFTSMFICPEEVDEPAELKPFGGQSTYSDRNPYHFKISTLRPVAMKYGFEMAVMGEKDLGYKTAYEGGTTQDILRFRKVDR